MGFILKLIASRLGPYVVIGLAVMLIGALGTAAYQRQAAKRYEAQRQTALVERDAARADVRRLLESVASKDVVIDELEASLLEWQTRAAASILANEEAGKRAQESQIQLNTARNRIRALSETDRGKPNCDAILEVDLAAVCSGRAAGLRQWDTHGRDTGTSDPRPDAGGPAR